MQQQKMTLKRLAALLGVHSPTVGRVMDPEARHMVSEEVAQRILKEATRFGYRPKDRRGPAHAAHEHRRRGHASGAPALE